MARELGTEREGRGLGGCALLGVHAQKRRAASRSLEFSCVSDAASRFSHAGTDVRDSEPPRNGLVLYQ